MRQPTETDSKQIRGFVDTYYRAALNFSVLLNGGATIVLVSFAASFLTSGSDKSAFLDLVNIIHLFVIGTIIGAIAVLLSLATYYLHYLRHKSRETDESLEETVQVNPHREFWKQILKRLIRAYSWLFAAYTFLSVVAAYILFFVGAFYSLSWLALSGENLLSK